jgi:hypothetical protein
MQDCLQLHATLQNEIAFNFDLAGGSKPIAEPGSFSTFKPSAANYWAEPVKFLAILL